MILRPDLVALAQPELGDLLEVALACLYEREHATSLDTWILWAVQRAPTSEARSVFAELEDQVRLARTSLRPY